MIYKTVQSNCALLLVEHLTSPARIILQVDCKNYDANIDFFSPISQCVLKPMFEFFLLMYSFIFLLLCFFIIIMHIGVLVTFLFEYFFIDV